MYRGRQKTFPRNDFLQDVRSIRPVCSNGKSRSVRPFRTHARSILPIGHPCQGTLSSDLKYTLENGLIYILAKTYGVRPIKVHAERIETFEFGGKAVGAGCSMGGRFPGDNQTTLYRR